MLDMALERERRRYAERGGRRREGRECKNDPMMIQLRSSNVSSRTGDDDRGGTYHRHNTDNDQATTLPPACLRRRKLGVGKLLGAGELWNVGPA